LENNFHGQPYVLHRLISFHVFIAANVLLEMAIKQQEPIAACGRIHARQD
jgi:hypothetical protein